MMNFVLPAAVSNASSRVGTFPSGVVSLISARLEPYKSFPVVRSTLLSE
jgi:hypothetical protein